MVSSNLRTSGCLSVSVLSSSSLKSHDSKHYTDLQEDELSETEVQRPVVRPTLPEVHHLYMAQCIDEPDAIGLDLCSVDVIASQDEAAVINREFI